MQENFLSRFTYVDDVINGAQTPMKALNFYEESKACLAAGGFRLRKCKTSDKQLQALIDKGENQIEEMRTQIQLR